MILVAYLPPYAASTAAGDVDVDGIRDIIVGAGAGAKPHVKAFDQHGDAVKNFFAYEEDFTGGVSVAAGDRSGDGVDDIIVGAGPGAEPHLRTFRVAGQGLQPIDKIDDFFAFDADFGGGVLVGGCSY